MKSPAAHTSESPDIFSSSAEYATRFSGDIGEWFLEIQSKSVVELLNHTKGLNIADIGGGHAQVIPALQKLDSQITVTGSSEQCSLLLNRFTDNSRLRFVQAKMLNLPFENGSFEAVICLRQISHISDWKKLVAELCRISSGKVIIDYPPLCSFNFFYSLLFPLKKLFEKNTREFLVFTREQINAEFLRHGFKPGRVSPQFLLPMVVYRGLKNRKIAAALEKVFSSLRLTAAFGSPVIAEFTKLN